MIINQSVEFLGMAPTNEIDTLTMIERAGRTCYKSEEKITSESYLKFFEMICKRGHLSVVEHSNLVITFNDHKDAAAIHESILQIDRMTFFRFSHEVSTSRVTYAGNWRAWIDLFVYMFNGRSVTMKEKAARIVDALSDHYPNMIGILRTCMFPQFFAKSKADINILSIEEQLSEWRRFGYVIDYPLFIFRMITDRGMTHELVRHRALAFSQESTRYVNYGGREMRFIDQKPYMSTDLTLVLENTEKEYNFLIHDANHAPQFARAVLPNCLAAEIVISGRYSHHEIDQLKSGWSHFLRMRNDKAAHPQMQVLAKRVKDEFDDIFSKGS